MYYEITDFMTNTDLHSSTLDFTTHFAPEIVFYQKEMILFIVGEYVLTGSLEDLSDSSEYVHILDINTLFS